MDQHTVTSYRRASSREDLALSSGERILAGGTWLYSEQQLDAEGFVDITTMPWPSFEWSDAGLRIGATCTIAEVAAIEEREGFAARPLFLELSQALLASFKVWNEATVGGNICRAYAAGSMITLSAVLDGVAEIWSPAGDYTSLVADLITGNGTHRLPPGDVVRAVDIPADALAATTASRAMALSEYGRSGVVVAGRVGAASTEAAGTTVIAITAATLTPTVLRYAVPPSASALETDVLAAAGYYTDPFGTADWRRHVSAELAEQVRAELAS